MEFAGNGKSGVFMQIVLLSLAATRWRPDKGYYGRLLSLWPVLIRFDSIYDQVGIVIPANFVFFENLPPWNIIIASFLDSSAVKMKHVYGLCVWTSSTLRHLEERLEERRRKRNECGNFVRVLSTLPSKNKNLFLLLEFPLKNSLFPSILSANEFHYWRV